LYPSLKTVSLKSLPTVAGKSLSVTMDRNWFSGCRDDEALKVFLEDLNRARAAYLEGGRLKITLANGEGIMYFKRG
jgi:hypothetical protein